MSSERLANGDFLVIADGDPDIRQIIPAGPNADLLVAQFHAAHAVLAPVPEKVRRFQAKAALLNAGLLETVQAAVDQAGGLLKLAWDEEPEFYRSDARIIALEGVVGGADALDELFRQASAI